MNRVPKELKYTASHEWAIADDLDKNIVIVGITDFAQEQLGELVYVELPEVGDKVAAGDEVCVLESVKAASDVFSPLSGKIVAINEDLEDSPGLVNTHPYHDGWLYKIEMQDPVEYDELLDAEGYQDVLAEQEEDD
jgi:glycine cleavage system H protein